MAGNPGLEPRAREIAAQVRRGERTARQACAAALKIIELRNPGLNAVVQMDAERSFAEADEVDRRVASREFLPLAGVPYTLKDNLWAAGWRVSQGSRLLSDFVAPPHAWCAARVRKAGSGRRRLTHC